MRKEILKKGQEGHLSDLKIGQSAKVLGLHLDKPEVRRHLLDMGITKGTKILIKKIAPMGDPVSIELRGYELCIRKEEMKNIDIEVIE
ncbi:MAG: FeoA family protein [Clostridia bacterium]|nr:FeoA family protein [Clostridia bacterium]